jgi:transposase
LEFEQNVRNNVYRYSQNIQPGEKTEKDFSLFIIYKDKKMKILKQVLGVDVAQKELVATLGKLDDSLNVDLYAYMIFANSPSGYKKLCTWMKKLTDPKISLQIVMEATGVYHESFANHLVDLEYKVCIVLPNKISNYRRTLELKTKTDKACSEVIAQFGLERKLGNWKKPKKIYKELLQLTRERDQIVGERVSVKNMLHAENAEAYPNANSLKRMKARIAFLTKQESQIKKELNTYIQKDEKLRNGVKIITSIPGIGELTALIILAETNGFDLIRNKKQLVSYAGLDVRERQSGTSVNGKPKISKRGNRSLRKAMHFPSLSSVKHNQVHKDLYARLVSKHGIKMKGLVAVQRKLLELAYILYKKQEFFDNKYKKSVLENTRYAFEASSMTAL